MFRTAIVTVFVASIGISAASAGPPLPDQPLQPIPSRGAVPGIVAPDPNPVDPAARRMLERRYRRELSILHRRFLGSRRAPDLRKEGLKRLTEFVDPAAFRPMVLEFARNDEAVRVAVLDHFTTRDEDGQAALAWTAIYADGEFWRNDALDRLAAPASPAVLRILDEALRSPYHRIANNAGIVAGALHATQTIPLLIFAQATGDPIEEETGDLAWIGIQTQHAFVADLIPVVGNNSGAFLPVMGVITEGEVLRIVDAVAIFYRTEIHRSLVNMTTYEFGAPTDPMGYDMPKWWRWHNEEFVPLINERIRRREFERMPDGE